MNFKTIIIFLFLFLIQPYAFSQQSKFSDTGPDAKTMGEDRNYGTCTPYGDHWRRVECRIGNFSETYKVISELRSVSGSGDLLNFKFAQNPPQELIKKTDEYLSKHPVMGFLIIKNGEIIIERYQYGRKADMIFRGMSMSKTFTAMLVGIAHQKGFIKSLDDTVGSYWSEIKNSPYGNITIKEVLQMSSGVEGGSFNASVATIAAGADPMYGVLLKSDSYLKPEKFEEYLNNLQSRGVRGKFRYSSLDTMVLGRILNKVTKKNISSLTSEWLWQPMGGSGTTKWLYAQDGIEFTESGLTASLNDYGRFGVLLANNGKYKNNQVIPLNFLIEATDINKTPKSHLGIADDAFQYGYGYQTLYGHMVRVKAKVGQIVKRGEVIGYIGSTGKSTGPHCHYEVIKRGVKVDPVYYFYNDLTPAQFDRILKAAAANKQSLD
jgi:CubicO group peptidase (beta-lactamase class C family)